MRRKLKLSFALFIVHSTELVIYETYASNILTGGASETLMLGNYNTLHTNRN